MKADVIVIGSGASGMSAAIVLAKAGKRVVVLEQHTIPGGLMQTFRRGTSIFPTGVHLLGSLRQNQITWSYLQYMGVLANLKPVYMKEDSFLQLRYPDHIFDVPQGHAAFKEKLISLFPAECVGIVRYFSEMKRCAANVPFHSQNRDIKQMPVQYLETSLETFLNESISDPRLKQIFKSFVIFYGSPANQCPLHVHFLVLDTYLNSAWQLDEGELPLSESFVHAFRAAQGTLCTGQKVASLETNGDRISGVKCQSGESFSAPLVIYSGHPANLIALTNDKLFSERVRKKVVSAENTRGFYGVNMIYEGATCPLSRKAIVHFTGADPDHLFSNNDVSLNGCEKVLFTSAAPFPVNGKFTITHLFASTDSTTEKWIDSTIHNRSEGYNAYKREIENYALTRLKEMWPQNKDQFKVINSFSPLTVRDYTGAPSGTPYGYKKSKDSRTLLKLAMPTNIHGLYLTGHNLFVPGVLGAIASAMHTCSHILGHDRLMESIIRETEGVNQGDVHGD